MRSDRQFGRIASDLSWNATFESFTAAIRAGGSSNIGNEYEFYQSNTLGGGTNLRGYRSARYAGKSNVFQNTELRMKLKTMHGYFLRGDFGMLSFFDCGRVWIPNENSNTWHTGYGLGVWFVTYNMMAFTATYGISEEKQLLTIKAGFLF